MTEDYKICVGSGCVVEPKVFTMIRGSIKHNLPNCRIVEFQDILKKQIPPTIIDELLQKNLDQLLADAELHIDQIFSAFNTLLIQIRQTTRNLITENFLEMRRMQLLLHATQLKTLQSLTGLRGDRICVLDASKLKAGIDISEKSQAEIILQLQDVRKNITNILTMHCRNIAQNVSATEQQSLIQQEAQDQLAILQQSIPVVQIELQPLKQNVESNINEQMNLLAKYVTFTFKENRTLQLNQNQKGQVITIGILNKLIQLCIQLKPLKLRIELNNTQITDIKPISMLKSLLDLTYLWIDIRNSQVVDIEPISEFKFLKNLTFLAIGLSNNQVVDIKPISKLKSLRNLTYLEINLWGNKVVDIQPISDLKSLLNLIFLQIYLSNNQVVDIKPISGFKSLFNLTTLEIDLSNNQVVDIKPITELKSLMNLTTLDIDLSNNQVVDIKPISELKSLMNLTTLKIDLSNNQVVDITHILELKSLLDLNSINIEICQITHNLDDQQSFRF